MFFKSILLAFLAAQTVYSACTDSVDDDLIVDTELFTVKGMVSPNSTAVRIFKGVPYAEPPIGALRFRPPVTKKKTSALIDATRYAPVCIPYNSGSPTVYTQYIIGDTNYPGAVQSEDCLYLNIWAPRATDSTATYAVMIWIHGGGFTGGAAAQPYKEGTFLVKNQNVIVVSMDYRLAMFGFPNAAALDGIHLNPGLLDIRKAVEWTYNNIAHFGGDPERMILFGQSAGAVAVDYYSYAYATDPLVHGFISETGQAEPTTGVVDPIASNFTYIASMLNCTATPDKDSVFRCMQNADAQAIINVWNKYNATANGGKPLGFGPQIDNETIFANYTDRRLRGLIAQGGYLTGNNENEFTSLLPYNPNGVNQTLAAQMTNTITDCPTAKSVAQRAAQGIAQWRYWYRGVYPNTNPLPWLGAYHSSEIPQIWGTAELYYGNNTPIEAAMSAYMQTAWAEFAKDPIYGLTKYGWPRYDPGKNTLIQLGVANATTAVFTNHQAADSAC